VTTHAVNFLSPESLIETFGLIGILLIIFAETGLLIGFFLPGDSLLFLAGVAASGAAAEVTGVQLPIGWLLIGAPICAIAGAQVGHLIGAKVGPHLFSRPDSRLFKREYVEKAEHYFEKFGPPKAVILARFIPIVRTFLNPLAGALEMPARTFFVWNVIGGLIWTVGIILTGYLLGDQLAGSIDTYLLPGIAVIVLISVLPIALEMRSGRNRTDVSDRV
jgi:membrane-associated protein